MCIEARLLQCCSALCPVAGMCSIGCNCPNVVHSFVFLFFLSFAREYRSVIADLRSWGRELSIPGGGFPIRAFWGTENFGDTHPAISCPNPHPHSGLPLLRAACHAFQATDRRLELRSEVVGSCRGDSRVPMLQFSSFW